MTAELVRGQNHLLPVTRVEIRVSAGTPVIAGATLNDEQGRMRDTGWFAHPAEPQLPGLEVSRQAAAVHRLAVDLAALPEDAHRVNVLLALPAGVGGPTSFAGLATPFVAVTGLDGEEIASYTVEGLSAESAVVTLELYRKQDAWKVRAVGQGYAEGLAAMLGDQGLPEARQLADEINEAVAAGMARSIAPPPGRPTRRPEGSAQQQEAGTATGVSTAGATSAAGAAGAGTAPVGGTAAGPPGPAATPSPAAGNQTPAPAGGPVNYQHPRRAATPKPQPQPQPDGAEGQPVAGDAPGWSMEERLYNQVWGMFEDLARTVAAYRSAVDFADSRMERELEKVLDDPRTRVGPVADAARSEARAKHSSLVAQAQTVLDRDIDQLVAESQVVEPALPPALARWDNPVWQAYQPPTERPMALRVGDLSLPEGSGLRIPMLLRLPLDRGLWIDSGRSSGSEGLAHGDEVRQLAAQTATALAARLIAVHPAGEFSVHVIDPAGSASGALAPLVESGALHEPPAVGAAGVSAVLERLTQRVDLVQMAVRSGATDALPDDLDIGDQLLIVHDFPHGFDDRAVTQLRYLADEGPSVGVGLMMVADRDEARGYGPVLDPLWRSLMRLTPVPDDHLADPWVGHAWTYEPPLAPSGSQVLPLVLRRIVAARQSYGG
ncbi:MULTISPECIES: TerD family protein [unclassified Streptomyces]|uniref:TerD family protein n=1 Tax=unclassified Streptomyces TaxID=2593676 RepID=UPI002DD8DD1D|nr:MULTISPECIES: TerD family protein [unclassified Streptomyces]WSA97410.1 TerD family protein [Streptomyces sp. NBC_01795]WSB81838.1 TerD family protein [Streptomyces sp. NBC_01775]WSS17399.1 TerD family protein [Streptomyces sp. NBC_01186]WSS46145.1 TerD family protein [Streptomyces sp. NBC_01187]